MTMTNAGRRGVAYLGVWAVAMLAACTTTSTTNSSVAGSSNTQQARPAPTSAPAGRDLVTASDESDGTKRARVRLELAAAYFGRKQYSTALDEVKLALAADQNIPGGYNLRGLVYAALGDDGLAEESFRRALQINAQDADAMQNYAWYMCQRNRFAEADDMFARTLVVPQYRGQPRTLLTQGICQARAGKSEEAERTLTKSYEMDSGNPATAVNLTEVLIRRNELERARFYIRRVNGNPDYVSAQTLWLAARVEHKLGNAQGEREFGDKLKARFPTSREAIAFDAGRFDE